MFEFHGWATIRDTADCDDLQSEPKAQTVERIRQLIAGLRDHSRHTDLQWVNGALHLSLGGLHNHRRDQIAAFFTNVAAAAPGSYGVLYVRDDEDPTEPNTWRRLAMRRGELHDEPDTSLSPHVDLVEDECVHDGAMDCA